MSTPPPLAGITVLDLTRHLPGPLATMMMADLGARVIKVENPREGDPVRLVPPLHDGLSQAFAMLNRGKQSLALDLKEPRGREVFLRLAARSQVVVEGFRPGVLERLGIGYGVLERANPRIILCSISGYGQDGPLAGRAGHDINYQALAGVLGTCGPRDGAPQPPAVQIADVCGGAWQALAAVLGALLQLERDGRGQWLDVSMTDGVLTTTILALQEVWAGGEYPGRGRTALSGQGLAGYGVFETADGKYLAVGALEPRFFAELCRLLGVPELENGWAASGAEADRIRERLAQVLRGRSRAEWLRLLAGHDVCVEPVLEGAEVLEHEQLRHRGLFHTQSHPQAGELTVLAGPLRLRGARVNLEPAPALGEHSRLVLGECGLDEAAVEELVAAGVVAV